MLGNVFIASRLDCPDYSYGNSSLHATITFLESTNHANFSDALGTLTSDKLPNSMHWSSTRKWLQQGLSEYKSCDVQRAFAEQLSHAVCGAHGESAASLLASMWMASWGLALLFLGIVLLLIVHHPASEHLSATELLSLFGGPVLIDAFGDVRGVVRRHANSRKISEAQECAERGLSWRSLFGLGSRRMFVLDGMEEKEAMEVDMKTGNFKQDLAQLEMQVASEYNVEGLMSTTRPRRSAFHGNGSVDGESGWYMGGGESCSESLDDKSVYS